jgi:DNA-binding response OmpR family regulator
MTKKVLIVDDEPDIADILEAYLQREGYRTTVAHDGLQAIRLFREWAPDLVLLDVLLPKHSGTEVLSIIRETSETAVIMVTAVGAERDKIDALRFGADDYIVKPFNPKEVVARVGAVLRRAKPPVETPSARQTRPRLRRGGLSVDFDGMQVVVDGVEDRPPVALTLTRAEFNLLATLMHAPGKVFTRFELLEVCMPQSDALERVIDTHIHNLRRKLGGHGIRDVPQGVRGIGYRFDKF